MVPAAAAQEETLDEKRHGEAARRDRQGKEFGGSSTVSCELDRVCGWHRENNAHDQSTEVHLSATRLIEGGCPHASCVVSPR
jgi:hypothetical protein